MTSSSPTDRSDRGLWISWYDLPEAAREDYLAWLHGSYIPRVLERPGVLHAAHYETTISRSKMSTMRGAKGALHATPDASVPTGSRYILIFGAEDTNVFGHAPPATADDRKSLAMRIGERVNVMAEAARVDGPQAATYEGGMALPPCIQLGSFNCQSAAEADMLAWYAQCRMPAMTRLPGCIRTRKLASVAGWAKHAILYEFVSLEARNRHFVQHETDPKMIEWGDRVVRTLTHAPGSANLAERLWPAR